MNSSILQTFGWFSLVALISSIPQPTTAQPITPAPDGTGSRITPDGQRYDIDGGTLSPDGANLFHSFQKFGLDQGQTANFISNPQIHNILGRVVGGDPSIINGLIQITGGNSNLFLMNPAGILFGPNASLNIPADFTATTASGIGFGNSWFNAFGSNDYANLVGAPNAFSFNMSQLGTIINEGNLTLTNGSSLNLFANTVINTGTLATPGGNINITAVPNGNTLRISQPGHILSLEIIPTANNNQSLPQLLTGGDPIHHATTVQKLDDGTIRLTGSQTPIPLEPGVAVVGGNLETGDRNRVSQQNLDINPINLAQKPGFLNILGDKIALIGANIDASGTNGGGNIHIGGNYQGAGPLPNATHTYIDPNTNITANAISGGNGGEIIIWSDNTTQFHGNISATGIENGGFVEVSGKQNLIFRGNADLSATSGNNGTLLLDPENITIVDGSGGAHDSQLSDNQILFGDAGTTFTISETKLESLDGNAAVELQATNNITIEDLTTDNQLTFQSGSGAITLTADADNDGSGAFTMNSGDSIIAPGRPFTINAASITLGNLNTSSPTANGGAINLNAAGQITTGNLDSTAGTTGNGGNITITSTNGGIDITAGLLDAHSFDGNGGNINLMAAADIKTGAVNSHSGQLSSIGGPYGASINAGGTGEGGDVTITSQNGGIEVGAVQAVALSHGGNITLAADLDIKTANLESSSTSDYPENPPETWANAGNVSVTSSQGSIQTANIFAVSWRGTAGNVQISALEDIQTGDISSSFIPSVPLLDENFKPQGGDINITSHQGEINLVNQAYGLYTSGETEGGDININAANNIRFYSIRTSGNKPGNITINSRNGGINGRQLYSDSNQGNGGNIIVNTASNINITNISSNSYNGSSGGDISITSSGGSIDITNPSLLSQDSLVITSSAPKGIGGHINITAFGNITTSSINSFGYLQGGNISITSHANSITIRNGSLFSGSIANGTGGDISLSASNGILTGNINSSGESGGGDITLTSTWGDIDTSGGQLNADSTDGTNGNIAINAYTGSIIVGELTGSQNINIINGGTDNPLGNNPPAATVDADADTINRQSGQVSLQAHNDITVSEPIVTSSISSLELKAGRNININADIDTSSSNGNITLQGNHNGANPTYRQPGSGNIIMAPGTNINAGSGDILMQLGTLAEVGKITLANLDTTGSVNVIASGGNIQAADSGSMITANKASFLTYENGGIGTPDEPLAITVNNLSAQAGSSGAFFNSPHQGVTVGGTNGQIFGISTSGGGDIGVSALGNITISENISTQVGEGNAGKITITSTEGSINSRDSKIISYSIRDNGGDVNLSAAQDITTSSIESFAVGNAGQITITSHSGGIDVGDISSVSQTGNAGFVTLTADRDIKTMNIASNSEFGNWNSTINNWNNNTGRAGDIAMTSRNGKIDTTGGSLLSNAPSNSGNITMAAFGEIRIGFINARAWDGVAGNITLTSSNYGIDTTLGAISTSSDIGTGGNVNITAVRDIKIGSVHTDSNSGQGGHITITTTSGSIDTTVGQLSTNSSTSNGGAVELVAPGNIRTGNIYSSATGNGVAGNINITSSGGGVDTTGGSIRSYSAVGNGGAVSITASGSINTGRIESYSRGGRESMWIDTGTVAPFVPNPGEPTIPMPPDGSTPIMPVWIENFSPINNNLSRGGNITITTTNSNINTAGGKLQSYSLGGDGGAVSLNAAGDIRTGIIESYSRGRGEGGNITITSSSGAIDATGNLGSYAVLSNGGDVILKAPREITTTNISSRSGFEYQYVERDGSYIQELVQLPDSQGNGGNITIESRNSSINTSGGHLDSRSTGGGAGHITITANQDITTSRLLSSAEGVAATLQGGDITITSKQGSINTTAGDLSQEVVILATDDAATVDVASIFGQAQANLQAHATAGTGGNVTLEAAGNITTSHISSFGPATSGAISVTSGGNIQTGVLFSFSESGQAGSVTLTGNNGSIATNHISSYGSEMGGDVTITGKSFDIGAATINSYSENGTAGNVTINVNGDFTLGGDAARSGIRSEGAQSGGNISISSNSGTINTRNSEVLSYSEGGTAGNVMLRADGDVATGNIRSQGSQQGGNLSIISFNGAVDTSWGLLSSYSDNGTAGYASLSAFGDVSTGDISSYGYLSGGSISLGSTNGVINTTWGKLESFSPGGDAGAVTLEAPGNIATGDIVSEGNNTGGSITITTDGAVDLTNGTLNSYSARGRAGNVTITGKNDISLGGDAARSAIRSEGYGAGGDITITSIEGNIDTSRGNLDTYSLAGEAGTIILRAGGSVNSAAMTSYGNLASGDVTIQANGGNLTTGEIKTIAPNGTSGTVTLNNFSHNGDIVTANITTEGGTAAGDITVKSTDGAITTENLSSSSSGGDGGYVTLEAEEDITAGNITSSGENNSGDIAVTSNDGSVTTDDIATTANQGDAGDVTVQAENDINTGNISSVAGGNSGDITVNSDSGSVNSGNIATIAQTGASGDVTVGAFGDINTGDITSQGALGSGDINLTSVTGQVNTGEVYTNTGTVNITAGADVVNSVSPVNGDLNPNEAMLANPGNPAIANQLAVMNELILTVQNDASMNSSLLPSEKVFSQETLSSRTSQELLASLKVMNSSPLAMNAESAVLALEKSRGDEYGAYFGQDFSNDLQSTVSIREALGKIAAETGYQSAIIYVMAQPDQLELIVVTGSGQPIRKTVPDAPRDKVLATVEEFRNKLTSSFRTNSQTYLPSAQQLYQWLIAPIEAELQAAGINTLLFSMDTGLRSLPMAALHDGHQFLVEKYSMSLIPSVSLIDTRYRHLKDTRVLAMGASMFEDLAPLPAVPVELSAVTEDLWQGEEFLNENFTRDNLVQQRRQNPYPMIHLATHADFKPGAPENSYIQLWGEEQLRLDELRELGWQNPAVDLLVLSACRTALGDEQAEMGFAGLAVQAGVKSALASLWYVSDEGTLALMTEFYRHLEGAKIKGEALRQAQLAMIRGHMDVRSGTLRNDAVASLLPLPPELEQVENSNLSHPYYWSGFTMIGSPW